jgi:predicted nucleic-acid-binding Zn-ribbon protein
MPESPRMVPLYLARIADLRHGRVVAVTCRGCGHVAEMAVSQLRQRLAPGLFVKHLGPQFRCRRCGCKGAEIDARLALGH